MAGHQPKQRVLDQPLTLEELACTSQRRRKWHPRFVRLAREYSRAGITSNAALARLFAVDESSVRAWRDRYPDFDAAILSGGDDLAVECTSRMLDFSREGSESATRYLLDRRCEAFKPKAALDHTSNGHTLSGLLAEHGAMSDEEARTRGLIYDAPEDDRPVIDDVEYGEAEHRADDKPENGHRLKGYTARNGWQSDDMDDLRRRGLIKG